MSNLKYSSCKQRAFVLWLCNFFVGRICWQCPPCLLIDVIFPLEIQFQAVLGMEIQTLGVNCSKLTLWRISLTLFGWLWVPFEVFLCRTIRRQGAEWKRRTINLLWTSISVFQAWWTGANKMLRAVFCTEEQQPQMKDVKTSYVCNFLRFLFYFWSKFSTVL